MWRDNGLVRIGGVVQGLDLAVEDPDGWLWTLVNMLDGTRTTGEVIAHLAHGYPHRAGHETLAAIEDLVSEGFVEDAAEDHPLTIAGAGFERYEGARNLWRWMDNSPRHKSWDAQILLAQARVVVIGIGGVGCTAARSLVMSGVGHVHCVDPDVVERSNLGRQSIYVERDVGRPKVEVAVERLPEFNSGVLVTGERLVIDGVEAMRAQAARADVLLLAADSPSEIRSWASQACARTGTQWVHGGYHGPQIGYGLYRPGSGPCYDCLHAGLAAHRRSPAAPGLPAQAATADTAGMTGHLTAYAALRLLTDVPSFPVNCEYGFNLFTVQHSAARGLAEPRPGCPACG